MEPEFAAAVSRVRPGARVAVLYEGASAEPAGFLPYERGALGQGRAIGLGVSDCQGAVLRPGLALEAGELLRACSVSSFAFDNLEADQALFVPHAAEEHATFVIDVEKGYETYESVLRGQSPKFLKTTLAKERRLGRQAGPVRFVFDERDLLRSARSSGGSRRSTAGPGAATGSRRSGSLGSWAAWPGPGLRVHGHAVRPVRRGPSRRGPLRPALGLGAGLLVPGVRPGVREVLAGARTASADGRGGGRRGHRPARHGPRPGRVQGLVEDGRTRRLRGRGDASGSGRRASSCCAASPPAARTVSSSPGRVSPRWRRGP